MSNELSNEQPKLEASSSTVATGGKRTHSFIITRFRVLQQRIIASLPQPLQEIIGQLEHRELAYITAALLFTSFLLLLLVALSAPIIKSVYIFKLQAVPVEPEPPTIVADQISFGVYGYCLVSCV